VDGLYFSAVIVPKKPLADVWFETTEAVIVGAKPDARTPATFTNVTCVLTREPVDLAAGATHRDSYQIFIGPKRPQLMAQYQAGGDPNYSLEGIIYYGWPIFAAVARAMLAVLHFFYSFVGNYGIAIVMLTVLVRGALFPISYKQTQNMARMQALKPEMDRITERYKDDMQKRSQAIQELYRKNKINPLGGCLPVFLQLPIFIGLYRALAVDIELRQSALFGPAIRWCSNLAAPDMLLNWSAIMPDFVTHGQGLFALGPYLNILPLVTVCLFLVTQKMAMPEPTNEQAAMQQKMMKYMTVFMGLLFYKVAAGLCLYFIASSIWGIGERKLLPKPAPPGTDAGGSGLGTGGKRTNGGPRPDQNGSPKSRRPPKVKKKK
jgi:YidC/Oxa1 family membrane protein insertase